MKHQLQMGISKKTRLVRIGQVVKIDYLAVLVFQSVVQFLNDHLHNCNRNNSEIEQQFKIDLNKC